MALALPPLPPVALPLEAEVLPPSASASDLPPPKGGFQSSTSLTGGPEWSGEPANAAALELPSCVLPVSALPPLPPYALALPPYASLSPWSIVDSFSCSDPEFWWQQGLLPPQESPEPELWFSWPTWALLEALALPP